MNRETAVRLHTQDVGKAWSRYLADTRNLIGTRYEESEPHIWLRLQDELKQAAALRLRRLGAA